MNSKLIKATASTVVLGATLVACTPTANHFRPVSASANATPNDRLAVRAHAQAERAMQAGDIATALAAMEHAVELSPQDVGYRKTLAELYLKTGRFVSAEATYADVVTLNPGDAKAAFFVALCQMAQGRTTAAMAQIASMDASIDAADIGLAYALAGDFQRALYLLEPAARETTANGRVRQNLALAYALAGNWKQARLIAEQDVSPSDLNNRMQQWAALASMDRPEQRVAALLAVSPVSDPGQPAQLALRPAAPAADTSAEAVQPEATVTAEAVEAPVAAAPVEVAVATPAPVEASQTVAAPAAAAAVATPEAAPVKKASLPAARTQLRKSSSQFVIQLGSFGSPAQVERAYAQFHKRFGVIANYEPLSTTVQIAGKGTFHRLSIAGFDSQAAAATVCRQIKAQGGACFVRINAGDAPVQWASRYTGKA